MNSPQFNTSIPQTLSRSQSLKAEDNNVIPVLSWNICFGCMTHNPTDRTGLKVVKQCQTVSNTKKEELKGQHICNDNLAVHHPCMDNLINYIINIPQINKFSQYDFIGFQESSGWEKIVSDPRIMNILISSNETTGYLNYIHGFSGFEDMITFYNAKKYILNAVKFGNIVKEGRPYTILFLTEIATGNNFIVINIHSEHKINVKTLQTELSKELHMATRINVTKKIVPIINIHAVNTTDITDIITDKDFHIIFMGDTNENVGPGKNKNSDWINASKFWNKNFQPFSETGFEKIESLVVSVKNPPPVTCCFNRHIDNCYDNYPYIGDYILVSENLISIVENIIPIIKENCNELPVSDHLPVLSIITTNTTSNTVQNAGYIKKRSRKQIKKHIKKNTKKQHKHKKK